MNSRMHREEGLSTFEEISLYACPKFITANGPPYNDPSTLPTPTSPSVPTNMTSDPTRHHLRALTAHYLSLTPVPVLRSLLKLYTSLDTQKLAGFLDAGVDDIRKNELVYILLCSIYITGCTHRHPPYT